MRTPRYPKTITLTEAEQKRVDALQKKGISIIDIFRKGIEAQEKAR